MKWIFTWVICLVFLRLGAQQVSSGRPQFKQVLLEADTFVLDTFIVVKGSVKVLHYQEGVDYKIDYYKGTFINLNIPKQTLLSIEYLPFRYTLPSKQKRKELGLVQPEFMETVNPYRLPAGTTAFNPIAGNEGLQTSGSIMRGLSIGNTQNAIVNANLNLQLAGKLNNEIDVLAAISDENNPIQPEGNTQELQDFDRVFIQFSKLNHKLIVGDYLMLKPEPSYFLNYYKKSRGLASYNEIALNKKQLLRVNGEAALSRGRFARNVIQGQEGNQGPYRLQGANGELFIIIISGTEAVYLDGQKLTRGEQNDYTIDYNTGEIVFMPKKLITQFSRIIVEFQYSDRNYARTVLGFNTQWESKNAKVYLNYFTEQDNKNQSFQQVLSDSNKLLLASVGDQLSNARILSEVKVNDFNTQSTLYRKIDTLGYNGVYVHAPNKGEDSVFYELRFSFVGANSGNYKQGASAANGRVFIWVEPINGVPQGDFEPIIQLVAPNRMQMLNLGTVYNWQKGQELKVEFSRSSLDKNLFSELDKKDDAGYAVLLGSTNELVVGNKGSKIQSFVNYEFTSQRFRYVERYRNVEFNRIWNRQLSNESASDTGNKEHILQWKLGYVSPKNGFINYQFSYYNKNTNSFSGLNQNLQVDVKNEKNRLQTQVEWLTGKRAELLLNTSVQTEVRNLQSTYTRDVKWLLIGLTWQTEESNFKRGNDTLLSGSYAFQKYSLLFRSKDSSHISYYAEANVRYDQLPMADRFEDQSLAKELKLGLNVFQKNFNKLNIDFSFRDFQLLDSSKAGVKPERILLARITYDYSFFKRLITANTYLQLGSGNELRRDFQYVEVPIGQGFYVWKDFNGDGLKQLNEFQIASFADRNLANYIKVFLPTTSLISIQSTQFSQTFTINGFSAKRYSGFKGFVNKFSNQAALRLERKLSTKEFNPLINWNWLDTSIVSLSSLVRNTLFFNRNDPKYGFDFTYSNQRSKAFQTNGYESRDKMDYNFGARYSWNANWTLTGNYIFGQKRTSSEFFSSNDFRYNFNEYKPKISYQFQQIWRVSLDYNYIESFNIPELGGEQSKLQQGGVELRYSFPKIGVVTAKYSLFQVEFNGNLNSPLAYDMLQGLSKGNNQILSFQWQQRIGQNLQINFNYEGRKSGEIPIIHTGKMEARYLF
ncbi:MAG: hypothetical protein MH472_01000 [Bacteroidia bacterium]|nr:hypothetical protein [Bacteroidia bacterium]